MALEDRVKALEQEVAVLKDQIRNTLLEIQEQVLIHYYPELRANEMVPVGVAMPPAQSSGGNGHDGANGNGRGNGNGTGNGRGKRNGSSGTTRRYILEELHPDDGMLQAGVAGSHNGAGGNGSASANGLTLRHSGAAFAGRDDGKWATVKRLMVWARDAVGEIGAERTIKLVEIAAKGGSLDTDAKEALLQIIALGDGEVPAARVSMGAIVDTFLSLNQILGSENDAAEVQWLMEEAKVG
ncbi:MAG: hypothetical protein ACUVX9_07525 [Anaerolineae bacterium]